MPRTRGTKLEPWRAAWAATTRIRDARSFGFGISQIMPTAPAIWFRTLDDPRRAQLTPIELSRGLERERSDRNAALLREVWRTRRTQLVETRGWLDVFVPVLSARRCTSALACGPVRARRPTYATLADEWRKMGGRDTDDEFLAYVRCALESHVFEGQDLVALLRCLEELAASMGGSRLEAFRLDGEDAWRTLHRRIPETKTWEVAAGLVDRDLNPVWTAPFNEYDRTYAGLTRLPNQVVAMAPLEPMRGSHAAEILVSVNELQRACAAIGRDIADTISGRLGDEAVSFLTHVASDRRSAPAAFAERVAGIVQRRLGVRVVCGIGTPALRGGELPDRYDEATWAMLWGLHRGQAVTFYTEAARGHHPNAPAGLYRSSRALGECFSTGNHREALLAVDPVIKDTLWASAGSVEAIRSHFVGVVWELLDIIERRGIADRRTSSEMLRDATERLRVARSARELTALFATLVRDLSTITSTPRLLGTRSKIERARRLIEQEAFRGRLDLATVARRVGASASHLSRAFQRTYGIGFAAFLLETRIEQSRRLLRETGLRVAEVSERCGFSSASHFHHVFRRAVHATPEQYRASSTR